MGSIANVLVKRKRNLGHWEGIIEEWILAIERFSRLSEGDVPYWYNERANVGVLSAAVWRAGGIALEEFQHEKNMDVVTAEDDRLGSKTNWTGRCDLWVSFGKKSERVEAKFKWINMDSERMIEFAEACLADAMSDAKMSKSDDGQPAIGVAFLPVFVKTSKVTDEKPLETYIDDTVSKVKNMDVDLVAWSFPIRLRDYVGEKYNNHLPGVILLAKKIN